MTVVAPERVVESGGAPKRRSKLIVGLILGVIIGGAVTYLVTPDSKPSKSWQRVASYSELRTEELSCPRTRPSPGSCRRDPVFIEDSKVFLIWNESEQPLALSAVLPTGGVVRYCETSGWFQDPEHGSQFDRLGSYALGPAPRGLDRYPVLVLGDDVFIDRSQVITGAPRFDPPAEKRAGAFCALAPAPH